MTVRIEKDCDEGKEPMLPVEPSRTGKLHNLSGPDVFIDALTSAIDLIP